MVAPGRTTSSAAPATTPLWAAPDDDFLSGGPGADPLDEGNGDDDWADYELSASEHQAVITDVAEGDRLDLEFVESFDEIFRWITLRGW